MDQVSVQKYCPTCGVILAGKFCRVCLSYCPTCDKVLIGNFCHICGSVLVPKPSNPKCTKCGEEIYENECHCRWCGARIERIVEAKGGRE